MGETKDIAQLLAEARARRQSAYKDPALVTQLAQALQLEAGNAMKPAERALADAVNDILHDGETRRFITALCRRVLLTTDPALQRDTLRALAPYRAALPALFDRVAQWRLKGAALLPERYTALAVREARRALESAFGSLVLPTHLRRLMVHVHHLSTEGHSVALNPLVPAVHGDKGAAQYMKHLVSILKNQDVAGVVVQPWRLCPHLSSYAPREGVRALARKLHKLIILSLAKGRIRPVIIESGLSPTAQLVAEALTYALRGQDLHRADVMLELPAYLKGTPGILRGLTAWAEQRAGTGAAPLKLLLVKGAHPEEEEECTARHGGANPAYRTQKETDARFKQLLHTALAANPAAITPVVGTSNIFDIAFALLDWAGSGRQDQPQFCLRGGIEPHLARVLQQQGARITLTCAVAPAESETALPAHLLSVLHGLSRPGAFPVTDYGLDTASAEWRELERQFTETLTAPGEPAYTPSDTGFTPTPCARIFDRKRLTALRHAGERECNRWQRLLPTVDEGFEGSEELLCERHSLYNTDRVDYRFQAMDAATLKRMLATAARAAQMEPEPLEERRARVLQFAAELELKEAAFIGLLMRECGITLEEAEQELLRAIDACRLHVNLPQEAGNGNGVVAVMPGNAHPLSEALGGIAAAWMTGNAVIYRPPYHSVLLGINIVQLLKQQGFDAPRLLTLVCTDETALTLAADSRVSAVLSGTGAFDAASLYHAAAGKPVAGGHRGSSSLYLAATADWNAAVRDIARHAFSHAGQCLEMPHIIITHASVYDNQAFRNALIDAVSSIPCGPGWLEGTQTGLVSTPLTHEQKMLFTSMNADESWLVQPQCAGDDIQLWSPGVRAGITANGFFTHCAQNVPAIGLLRVESAEEAFAVQGKLAAGLYAAIYSEDGDEISEWEQKVHACNRSVNCIRPPYPGVLPSGNGHRSTPMDGSRHLPAFLCHWQDADAAALEGVKTELPISPWNTLVPAPDAETSARLLTAAKSISAVWQTEFRNGRVLQENALFRTMATYRPHSLLLRADQALPDADLCIMLMAALAAGCELQLSTATMRPWMQNMLYPAGVDIAVETRQTYEGRLPALAEQGICVRDPAATESTRTAAAACGLELITRPAAANGHAELPCCVQELVETRRGNAPASLL